MISTLIERLEKATVPDRELDGLIAKHVEGLSFGFCGEEGWSCGECRDGNSCGVPLGLHDERTAYPRDWRYDERLPHYTGSIDAALGLVERVLPGQAVIMAHGRETPQEPLGAACIFNGMSSDSGEAAEAEAATLPLAICLATLRAIKHREQGK